MRPACIAGQRLARLRSRWSGLTALSTYIAGLWLIGALDLRGVSGLRPTGNAGLSITRLRSRR